MNQQFDVIPEPLLMSIASYAGRSVPGLTSEYILDEIESLNVEYNDISRRAEQLGLPNLLKYICTPFDINQAISLNNLEKYGAIPVDWIRRYLHHS